MTKRLLPLLITWLLVAISATATASIPDPTATDAVEQATALARRLSKRRLPQQVQFVKIDADQGKDVFTLESRDGIIIVGGNNAGSMAVGLNRYLNRYCKVTVSWYGSRLDDDLPEVLPAVPVAERVTARVPQRFFLNYCTWGYTMPFWGWEQWEHFIDWMALNGVNLPLAITGQEAVWYRVWTRLGMTDEQVRNYFTCPWSGSRGRQPCNSALWSGNGH